MRSRRARLRAAVRHAPRSRCSGRRSSRPSVLARVWVGLAGGPHIAVRSLPAVRACRRARARGRRAAAAGGCAQRAARRSARRGRAGVRAAAGHGGRPARAARELRARAAARAACTSWGRGARARGPLRPRAPRRRDARERGADGRRPRRSSCRTAPLAGGGDAQLARRRLRSGGHELHGVREHQPGESLRGVHWPATAHHGRLMVKELDDPAGDELAVVLDAAPRARSAARRTRASSSRSRRRARSWSARTPTRGACGSCSRAATASRRARASAWPRAGCWRARGRAASARRASSWRAWRPSASRWSRPGPAAFVGAGRATPARRRRDRPSSFDPAVPRDAAALAALRAAGCSRASSCGGPSASRAAAERPVPPRALVACAARCSRSPPLTASCTRATCRRPRSRRRGCRARRARRAPALVALRAGRRLGLLALAPAALAAAWLAAGHWPSPGAPLGGLAGQLPTRPRPGCRSCCRSTPTRTRSCARRC